MKAEMEAKMKYGFGGMICGAIVAMVVGFAWGGWVTAGGVQKMSGKAVLASQAEICVAQFLKDPTSKEKLIEIEKLSQNDRFDFVQKGGWDKMPGQSEAVSGLAKACAYELEDSMRK